MQFADALTLAQACKHAIMSQHEVDHNRVYTCQQCGASFMVDKVSCTVVDADALSKPCPATAESGEQPACAI